jgi:uncharacterized protein YjbI with pentapeptide repeats
MANEEHLAILRQGVEAWNDWRKKDPGSSVDLLEADLIGANLYGANLYEADLRMARLDKANLGMARLVKATLARATLAEANLREANLDEVNLREADLSGADLREAFLLRADLYRADLGGADLRGAFLIRADLVGADFTEANLTGASLQGVLLVGTRLENADLTSCRVHGLSAWDLGLEGAKQADLIISKEDQPLVTVDNLELAQFIYLLLNNERIRHVIDTITSKAVLILGRFMPERKAVLDALREELRRRGYLPILFDFDRPASQTVDETVSLLARMARFVVADLTDAKSVLQELRGNVPELPSVPVQPIIIASQEEPGMFDFFHRYPWVLETHRYASPEQLMADLGDRVIGPAEAKARELRASLRPAR